MGRYFLDRKKRLESLDNGRGINYIMDEAYSILGNPIVMFDTSYNMLHCTQNIATDDWLWNEITTLRGFSHETVDFFYKENFVELNAQSEAVAVMKSNKLKYDRATGKLFDKDGVQLGDITIVACMNPFEDGDMDLIEILCEILSRELQNSEFYRNIDRVYQESLLSDLLGGVMHDDASFIAEAEKLYGEPKDNLYLGVIDITQYDYTVTHLAYFRDLFRKLQAEYKYYIHMNYIVVIISTNRVFLDIEKDLGRLNDFFVKYKICAGISGGFHNMLSLAMPYKEAICALNYGLQGMRCQHIFMYDNIRVEHFLNLAKGAADIREIYSPIILLIQKYDWENNTSLLDLLYKYMLYGKNDDLTCEKMGITKRELTCQLATLSENFGIDWDNGDMLFNAFISIKMLDSLPIQLC